MQYVAAGTQGICPSGWHIPTLAEFGILKAAVNEDGIALKRVEGAGTNTSGFSAWLAGCRDCRDCNHDFHSLGITAYFWSSTGINAQDAYYMDLYNNGNIVNLTNLYYFNNTYGFSVRCLKD